MTALRLVPLVVLLAACDAAPAAVGDLRAEDLRLRTDADAYTRGDAVVLTLRNVGEAAGDAGGLGCTPLEVQTLDGWATSPAGNDRGCADVVIPLQPRDVATAVIALDGVGAGTYRFAFTAADGTVTTAPFVVG